jgi:hypothetical protein
MLRLPWAGSGYGPAGLGPGWQNIVNSRKKLVFYEFPLEKSMKIM